jgi:hypothetical protein
MALALAGAYAVTGFLVLAMLGAMREIVLLRAEVATLSRLIRYPPEPSYAQERASVPAMLAPLLEAHESYGERQLVAFVAPGCGPCEGLARDVSAAIDRGQLDAKDVLFFVWAATARETDEMVNRLPGYAVPDYEGRLARVCEIRGTPALMIVAKDGHAVIDFQYEGDVQWIIRHLTSPRLVSAA